MMIVETKDARRLFAHEIKAARLAASARGVDVIYDWDTWFAAWIALWDVVGEMRFRRAG